MPSPLPYFQFYARDWLSSSGTRDMSLAARGAYIDLLSYQWEDGDLPDSLPILAKRLGVPVHEFEAIWPELQDSFESSSPGRMRNSRLHEERDRLIGISSARSESGSKGGRPRKQTESETEANEKQNESKTKANEKQTIKQNESKKKLYQNTETEFPLSPSEMSPPSVFWFEDSGGDELAKRLAIVIRSSKRYEKDVPDSKQVHALVAWARLIAPDDDAIFRVGVAFANRAAAKRKREYVDPVATLKNWMERDEADWRRLKRAREIDAEREEAKRSKGLGEPKKPFTASPDRRGPIPNVEIEEVAVRDEEGSIRLRWVVKGSLIPIDRPWVLSWFDLHDEGQDQREEAERWCEAHGLRPDEEFFGNQEAA